MKKLIYNIAILLSVAAMSSCAKDSMDLPAGNPATDGVAVISMSLPGAITRADLKYDSSICDIKIYSEGGTRQLIRHYSSEDALPEEVWLLAGKYSIAVSLGSKASATFDGVSYEGEQEFTITKGTTTEVSVNCKLLNTIVAVKFDESVTKNLDQSHTLIAQVADKYDAGSQNSDNSLVYTDTREGYFIVPDNVKNISFNFSGAGSDGKSVNTTFERSLGDKKAGYRYNLTLKYTPEENGYLSYEFEVELGEDDVHNDFHGFDPSKPDPSITIAGDGFEGEPKLTTETLNYTISSEETLTKLEISELGGEVIYTNENLAELVTRAASDDDVIITHNEELGGIDVALAPEFFTRIGGGERTLRFTVTAGDLSVHADTKVINSGAYSLSVTDKWNGKGEINAYVYVDGASDVKIRYRKSDSDSWTTVSASDGGSNLWTADGCEGFTADTEYECQLMIGGTEYGTAKLTTDKGPQIPNADFETWSTISGVLCPYLSSGEQWWSSGNAGAKTAGKTLTSNVTDTPEGSTGRYAARLASDQALGVLAAGNIYLGQFVGTRNITKGVVRFGHSFDFTYRPKALKFWYKGEVDTVNIFTNGTPEITKGGRDKQQIYILLCAMPGPHIVFTGDTGTFLNLSENSKTISYCSTPIDKITTSSTNDVEGAHIIAYGVFEPDSTYKEWTEITLTLNYNSEYEGEIPTWLMLTASANKYGDYYSGCSTNEIYLDDVELVY